MRPYIRSAVALLLLSLAVPRAHACSQCLCGVPIAHDALDATDHGRVRLGLEDLYLSKSNGLEDAPGEETEREHRVSLRGTWSPNDRVAMRARLPWNRKEITEQPLGERANTEHADGLGDAEIVGLIRMTPTVPGGTTGLALLLGVTAPTGSNDVRDDAGDRLDAHLQPGTGAWSGVGGISGAHGAWHGRVEASVLWRLNGTNAHGYRYGDATLYNLGWTGGAVRGWQPLAQINGRSARRDRLEDGTLGEATGGTVLYAAPGMRWQSAMGLGIEAVLQVPFAEALNGDQTEHTTGRLALTLAR